MAPQFQARARSRHQGGAPVFAALDLGTNNCRLLMAAPTEAGFRVIDGYSEIVRLGEGLVANGRLGDAAMARAYRAIETCVHRISARAPKATACVATQACRVAENGARFIERLNTEFGLGFSVISPHEEAILAAMGCASLMDARAEHVLIVDIGGGSTELSLVDPAALLAHVRAGGVNPPVCAWTTAPVGVVTLIESAPEPTTADATRIWYDDMVHRIADTFAALLAADPAFAAVKPGVRHMIGTSGTVTSLAGLHFNLPRYQRSRVDGAWLTAEQSLAAIARVRAMSLAERAANPCIGPARADLVAAGCAILEAVWRLWPAPRIRVADRGLREGLLMRLVAQHRQSAR